MPTFYNVLPADRAAQQEAGDTRPGGPHCQLASLLYLLGTSEGRPTSPSAWHSRPLQDMHSAPSPGKEPSGYSQGPHAPCAGPTTSDTASGPSSMPLPPGSHPAPLSCLPEPSQEVPGTRSGPASPFLASPGLNKGGVRAPRLHPGRISTPARGWFETHVLPEPPHSPSPSCQAPGGP